MKNNKNNNLGIIGGGQLGMMLSERAKKLGFSTIIFSDHEDCPAKSSADKLIIAKYNDLEAIDNFCQKVDVITVEFEHIPIETLNCILDKKYNLRPNSNSISITQNRYLEKEFISNLGIGVVNFTRINDEDSYLKAIEKIGLPCLLKTNENGYDGKGQFLIRETKEIEQVWNQYKEFGSSGVIEEFIDFSKELSVIMARNIKSEVVFLPIPHNIHKNHILRESIVPSGLSLEKELEAKNITKNIADNLDYVGVIAVEFFLTKDNSLIVNEIAPRVHNSGHFSMDLCSIDQFELHIRAITDMDLINPVLLHNGYMQNIIGSDIEKVPDLLNKYNTTVHLYGKKTVKEGRKMGHAITAT